MYEGQDSQNNLSIHSVCCLIAFYECDDAISHICNKYFGRSAKCVNLPIWGVGFYFQYGGTMARQRGKPTMYTLPQSQYTASSAVPCASACGNLCGKPPTWWCLLASCVPRRVSNVPIVGWSRIAKHTERYFRINPDILPKDFPLPNKILCYWPILLKMYHKLIPGASPFLPMPTVHIENHGQCWQNCCRNQVNWMKTLPKLVTKESWDESIFPKLGMLFA